MKREADTFGTRTAFCQTLAKAWCEAAGDRLLPRRSQLTPRMLKDVLNSLFILEYLSPETIRFRLVGGRLTELLGGVQLTGQNNIDLVPPAQRPVRIARYLACANFPCGMHFAQPATLTTGLQVRIEHLILPILPDEAGDPLQFVGAAEELDAVEVWPGVSLADQQRTYRRVVDHVRFVDIGAGIPEQDPGLALMPA